jgi:hypothetical protein
MNNDRLAEYKIINGQPWGRADWGDNNKYGPDFDDVLDEELPKTAKECHEDWQDLMNSNVDAEIKAEYGPRLLAQKDLLRRIEAAKAEDRPPN